MTLVSRRLFTEKMAHKIDPVPIRGQEFQWFMEVGYFPANQIGYLFKRDWAKDSWFNEEEEFYTLEDLMRYLERKFPDICDDAKLGATHAWTEFLIWRNKPRHLLMPEKRKEDYRGADHD